MPLLNITQKAVTLRAFQLSAVDDMITAFHWLRARGYNANVSFSASNSTATLWLQKGSLNATAVLTDYLILENDATIRHVVNPTEAAALYQVA